MEKYLDINGLSHFWDNEKEYIDKAIQPIDIDYIDNLFNENKLTHYKIDIPVYIKYSYIGEGEYNLINNSSTFLEICSVNYADTSFPYQPIGSYVFDIISYDGTTNINDTSYRNLSVKSSNNISCNFSIHLDDTSFWCKNFILNTNRIINTPFPAYMDKDCKLGSGILEWYE